MIENFSMMFQAIGNLMTFQNLGAIVVGAIIGFLVGVLPGLGSIAAVSLLLPIVFAMSPVTGLAMLGALYYSTMYSGCYTAILLNIPGESAAVMTALDGYPMAKKGRPGPAMSTAIVSSFIGGTLGILIVVAVGPALARVGLKFGPTELAALMLLALSSIGWLMGDKPTKGIIAAMLGLILGMIGLDIRGIPRYNFGNVYLLGGLDFGAVSIGLFGFSEVLQMIEDRSGELKDSDFGAMNLSFKDSMITKNDFKRLLPPALRSGVLGCFVGIMPGAGATIAAFLGHTLQKVFKNKEPLGTGAVEGIAAAEAANNAASAGAFAPLLSLGIPGSPVTAIMLSAMMVWGLKPGPLLFTDSPELAWSTIATLFVANIITLVISLGVIPVIVNILKVPYRYMIPSITFICIIGAYAINNSMYGVILMLVFGVIGYVLNKFNYPLSPVLLAFVLSDIFEANLRKALITSQGSPMIFLTRPISLVMILILVALLLTPTIRKLAAGKKKTA